MFQFLENLRQKPEKFRKRVALGAALGVACVMLGVWFTVVYPDFFSDNPRDTSQVGSVDSSAGSTTPTPSQAFGASFTDGFKAFGSQLGELKNMFLGSVSSVTSASTSASNTSQ